MEPRYGDYPDRPDLTICHDCSTRATGIAIPRDEIPNHDQWHAMRTFGTVLGDLADAIAGDER